MPSLTHVSLAAATAALAVGGVAVPAQADPGGGATVVPGQAFYVDGEPYRTVATPSSRLPDDAPMRSFDVLYDFGGEQLAVAEAAPGMPGYNGGRWIVHVVEYADGWRGHADGMVHGEPVFVSDGAVEEAIAAGAVTVVAEDVDRFTCPVIPL